MGIVKHIKRYDSILLPPNRIQFISLYGGWRKQMISPPMGDSVRFPLLISTSKISTWGEISIKLPNIGDGKMKWNRIKKVMIEMVCYNCSVEFGE